MNASIIPAYLGWNNSERDESSLRLYATDEGDSPRWDTTHKGGRVIEYAAGERFGTSEGDRYLVVRVGNRFTADDVMERLTTAIDAALVEAGCV